MKIYILLLLCLFVFVVSCKEKTIKKVNPEPKKEEKKSTRADNVSILEKEFVIEGLNNISHKAWLYLPPNYAESEENYPVIYMHDAQNLFDDITSFVGEWGIDETLNKLYKKEKALQIKEFISTKINE